MRVHPLTLLVIFSASLAFAAYAGSNGGLAVSPKASAVVVGRSLALTATVKGSTDNAVKWSIGSSTCGRVSPTGVYTAPSEVPSPAFCRVKATSRANPGVFDVATLTISRGSSGPLGVWEDVTPDNLHLEQTFIGAQVSLVDPVLPSNLYVNFDTRGIWKSTDFGRTWSKTNTGENGQMLDTGRAWYAAIDPNADRDPESPPTLYFTQGAGVTGIWKSVNDGVDWWNIFDTNVFSLEGENISSDVGMDIEGIFTTDPTDSQRLLAYLHGCYGPCRSGYAIFESTNEGYDWIGRRSDVFTFGPHGQFVSVIDTNTWLVSPNTLADDINLYLSDDDGGSWTNLGPSPQRGIGRMLLKVGNNLYSPNDGNANGVGIYKSTDSGRSWRGLAGSGIKTSWVAATARYLYTWDGYLLWDRQTMYRAPIDDDTRWEATPLPDTITGNIWGVATFDGDHYVILVSAANAGIWRYVEP